MSRRSTLLDETEASLLALLPLLELLEAAGFARIQQLALADVEVVHPVDFGVLNLLGFVNEVGEILRLCVQLILVKGLYHLTKKS